MALSTTRNLFPLDWVGQRGGIWRAGAAIVAGSLVLAVSAKVQVPFWPVPMTLQSLMVLLLGYAFGARLAAATVLAYLAEGLVGLPVFAGAVAGPAYMAGPTGGYLVGFVAGAAVVGALAGHGWNRGVWRIGAALSLGHVVLFVPGVIWLAVLFGFPKAVAFGITPFLLPTLVKTALGIALVAAGEAGLAGHRAVR